MLSCSISGEVPEVPVVSIKSGHVFEKRLILKCLEQDNKCPITLEELSPNDLMEIKVNKGPAAPRPPSATSISSLLRMFQEEWDTLLLESFKMKKYVGDVREELSHALYQHDAACRVIARVTQERDKARTELSETKVNMSAALAQSGRDDMEVEGPTGFSEKLVNEIEEKAKSLQRWRKNEKKKRPAGLATKQQIGTFAEISTQTLHSPSESGILCMALNPRDEATTFTGGVDSTIVCYNRNTQKVVSTMRGHKKKVLTVKAHRESPIVLSGSADKTIRIWKQENDKWDNLHTCNFHNGAVNDISLHPLSEYFVSCSDDGSWAFNNLIRGDVVHQNDTNDGKINCVQFHPDGRLLGTGSSNKHVQIWELHSQNMMISLGDVEDSAITSLCFSENGYHLAVAFENGCVNVHDLRKSQLLHQFASPGSTSHKVQYDYTGQYLACAGPDIRIFQTKTWQCLSTLRSHSRDVMDIAWGPNAQYLGSASKDRTLKFYSMESN